MQRANGGSEYVVCEQENVDDHETIETYKEEVVVAVDDRAVDELEARGAGDGLDRGSVSAVRSILEFAHQRLTKI